MPVKASPVRQMAGGYDEEISAHCGSVRHGCYRERRYDCLGRRYGRDGDEGTAGGFGGCGRTVELHDPLWLFPDRLSAELRRRAVYGTVDLGGLYQTHGTPFDKNFPTGASYIMGAGGYGRNEPTAPDVVLLPTRSASPTSVSKSKSRSRPAAGLLSPGRTGFRSRIRPAGQRAAGDAGRQGHGAEYEALPFELQPLGLAGTQIVCRC